MKLARGHLTRIAAVPALVLVTILVTLCSSTPARALPVSWQAKIINDYPVAGGNRSLVWEQYDMEWSAAAGIFRFNMHTYRLGTANQKKYDYYLLAMNVSEAGLGIPWGPGRKVGTSNYPGTIPTDVAGSIQVGEKARGISGYGLVSAVDTGTLKPSGTKSCRTMSFSLSAPIGPISAGASIGGFNICHNAKTRVMTTKRIGYASNHYLNDLADTTHGTLYRIVKVNHGIRPTFTVAIKLPRYQCHKWVQVNGYDNCTSWTKAWTTHDYSISTS